MKRKVKIYTFTYDHIDDCLENLQGTVFEKRGAICKIHLCKQLDDAGVLTYKLKNDYVNVHGEIDTSESYRDIRKKFFSQIVEVMDEDVADGNIAEIHVSEFDSVSFPDRHHHVSYEINENGYVSNYQDKSLHLVV